MRASLSARLTSRAGQLRGPLDRASLHLPEIYRSAVSVNSAGIHPCRPTPAHIKSNPMPIRTGRRSSVVLPPPPPFDEVRIGDAAGEYRRIPGGPHRAWAYVFVAFTFEICSLSEIVYELLKRTRTAHNPDATILLSVAAGILLAVWVFNDRWRSIEAFSSRFCIGSGRVALLTTHICMIWVPSIAFVYANYRGLRKLLGA